MDGVQLSQGYRATTRRQFAYLFYLKRKQKYQLVMWLVIIRATMFKCSNDFLQNENFPEKDLCGRSKRQVVVGTTHNRENIFVSDVPQKM